MLEQAEHWQLERRRMFSLDSMAAIPPSAEALPEPDLLPSQTTSSQAPASALGRPSKGGPDRWRPGAGPESCATTRSLRHESRDRSFLTGQGG